MMMLGRMAQIACKGTNKMAINEKETVKLSFFLLFNLYGAL
jgi:hypothetical protein